MATCSACHRPLDDGARFCPACGAAAGPDDGATRLAGADEVTVATRPASSSPAGSPASGSSGARSGWLSSSGSREQGRFPPGTLIADRYRIVGRLGKGGMGEVFRADDLRLDQPVAMKFLPEALDKDPVRLAQLHSEVRLARQISHKNVCRVYDVGDTDGLPFLTMEYVDGEDLATLLRRIGRLPEDKALDIARQLCWGLAAAHERGVLHRDLKPANVMIDGQGQVRITDFGLAAIAGRVDNVRAGTPAYMAPEQLSGKEATVRSDVYALGLVLYEAFTGRRTFTAPNLAELMRQHDESAITHPSELVRDVAPAVERAILRCLEREPSERPGSALAVAAALPGGDPLAAALAAGETPSPEMVAAAGERQAVPLGRVVGAVAATLVLIVAAALWSAGRQLTTRTPLPRPPAVLADRAEQALEALGYPAPPPHLWWGFQADRDYLRYVTEHPDYAQAADPYAARPGGLFFFLRTSPRSLVPQNPLGAVTLGDPPLIISDMSIVFLDPDGRLTGLQVMPPQHQAAAPGSPAAADWSALFRLAGLDEGRFTPAAPEWLPRGHADSRAAWTGTLAERPDVPVRVEAAAWQGRPIYFQIVGPWTRPSRMEEAPVGLGVRLVHLFAVVAFVGLLVAALVVARGNVRTGRSDQRGAVRIASVAIVGQMITWLFNDPHQADAQVEVNRLFASLGEALFAGGVLYVMYLALEPTMRRYWPDSLLAWSRLVQGRIFDARVGRDVLAGVAAGALLVLLMVARWPLQSLLDHHDHSVDVANLRYLDGVPYVLGFFASLVSFQAMFNAMWCVIAIVALKRFLQRMWLVAVVASLFLTLVAANGLYVDQPGYFAVNFGIAWLVVALLVGVVIRWGLLATVVMFLTLQVMSATPWTLHVSRWDFPATAVSFLLLGGLALVGGWASRAEARA